MASPSSPFRLRTGQPVEESLHQAGTGEAGAAARTLARLTLSRVRRVHEARKSLKRIRTLLRLTAGPGQPELQETALSLVRLASRSLAATRDRDILPEVLHDLLDWAGRPEVEKLARRLLLSELDAADPQFSANVSATAATASTASTEITRACHTLEFLEWVMGQRAFDTNTGTVLLDHLRRIYRRGRKMAARKNPSADDLHTLRKRVKDLQHAAELIADLPGGADLFHETKSLAEKLGRHQDLVVLEEHLSHVAGGNSGAQHPLIPELLNLLLERRRELADTGLAEARSFFAPPPKAFVQRYTKLLSAAGESGNSG